jgi:hypothetical protein
VGLVCAGVTEGKKTSMLLRQASWENEIGFMVHPQERLNGFPGAAAL